MGENTTTPPGGLSRDEIFDLLSSGRRRYVIAYLLEHSNGAKLQELAREIAAKENDCAIDDVTKKQQKRVYVSLHQTHVPKLSNAGVIDRVDGRIVPDERASELAPYFNSLDGRRPWYRYYLVIVLVGGLAFALVGLNVGVFAAVDIAVVSVALFLAVAVLTGVYAWNRRLKRV